MACPLGLTKLEDAVARLVKAVEELASEFRQHREELAKIWQEMHALREEGNKIWQEIKAMREENRRILQEIGAMRESQEKLWEDNRKIWEEIKAMRVGFELRLDALSARWGLVSEEAFREGVGEILRAAGFSAGRWTYFDSEGYVYGHPSEVEVDVVVHNGKVLLVEITSALKRSDLPLIKRKAELYERAAGRKPDAVIVVTAFIHDKTLTS